jgi:hypothetical protein
MHVNMYIYIFMINVYVFIYIHAYNTPGKYVGQRLANFHGSMAHRACGYIGSASPSSFGPLAAGWRLLCGSGGHGCSSCQYICA